MFGFDVIPLGIISVIFVLCQTLVIGQWCFLCLVTAAISLLLVYWTWDEVRATLAYLRIVWKEHHDTRLLWDVFWGNRSEKLDAAGEQLLSREVI